MSTLSPLLGLFYTFRQHNERFRYLSSLAMEDNLHNFQEMIQADDLLFDPATKITLLHMAAASGSSETLRYLLDRGLAINDPDIQGNTPLHFAALCGYMEGISFLLDNGADLTAENQWEIVPWQVARTGKVMHQLHPEDAEARLQQLRVPDRVLGRQRQGDRRLRAGWRWRESPDRRYIRPRST